VELIYTFSGICRQLGKIRRNLWGRDSSVGITNRLWVGRSGDRISVEDDISATFRDGPRAHSASDSMSIVSLSRG